MSFGMGRRAAWRVVCVAALLYFAAVATAQAVTFSFTGSEQAYVVPVGVTEVAIDAIGAPGGNGCQGGTSGIGGEISADFAVSPGSVLYVEVGGPGAPGDLGGGFCSSGSSAGGFNGGGAGGGDASGGGGGASDVRTVSAALSYSAGSRLIVAGGGGGAAFATGGGNAGGAATGAGGGGAGALGAGGAAGTSSACDPSNTAATAGDFGFGGTGDSQPPDNGGGGGGGGYWGGGGGGCSSNGGWGGGGGSSYVAPSAIDATSPTTSTSAPSVTITPQTPAPPPQGPPGPQGQAGQTGATGAPGQNGATGASGPAGQIELVVCNTVKKTTTKNGHKHTTKVQKCSTRLVSGVVKFTIDSDDLGASVSRAHHVYATGVAVPTGPGQWQLVLTRHLRHLRSGRYTLTLRTFQSHHRVVQRTKITIT